MKLSTTTWRYILLVTFILVPVVNYLPFASGDAQGRFNEDYTTRVDAAGYAFSIWGVIFTGMLLFACFQLREEKTSVHQLRAYQCLIAAGLASIAFVPISIGQHQVLGGINLWWHLIALLGAYVNLRRHVRHHGGLHARWTYFAPSMYLGWISAATVIATALMLERLGVRVGEATAVYLALGFLSVLTAIGLYLGSRKDGVYALTVAWALVAVAFKQQDAAVLWWGGIAGAIMLGTLVVLRLAGTRQFLYTGR